MVDIQVIKPISGLEQYIDCYSFCVLSGEPDNARMKVIANACSALFIYLNGSKHNGLFNNKKINISYGLISPFSLRKDNFWMVPDGNPIKCVTVMFKFYGFHKLFGIPMNELFGSVLDVSELNLPGLKDAILKIEEAKENYLVASILNNYFIKQFSSLDVPNSRYVYIQRIISHIVSQKGRIKVNELCDYTSTTERTLENWFKTFIGASPREFINITKFHNLINEVYKEMEHNIDWQTFIHNYNYFDQSHLINTFKDATSVSPDYFLKHRKSKLFLASNGSGCLFFADNDNNNLLKENKS